MARELNQQQLKFVDLYIQTGNATRSYIDAGYKHKTINVASQEAYRLFKTAHIASEIKERFALIKEEQKAVANRVVEQLKIVAFGSLAETVEVDVEERKLRIKENANLDHLDIVAQSESVGPGTYSKSFNIKRSDRVKALDLLAKIFGLYDKSSTSAGGDKENSSERVLEALRKLTKE